MTDFKEIAHSGGKITFSIVTNTEGRRGYQINISSSRPVPMAMIAVYALAQGVPVAPLPIVGLGERMPEPPIPGCFAVFIQSDSEGRFGHNCPACGNYWRSGPWPQVCPYCAVRAPAHEFLSQAQRHFVKHYCDTLGAAMEGPDGDVVIDMDAVADATEKQSEKPAFYVSEQSQQRKFFCSACGEFNDILGRFGYCSLCGTRSDLADFEGRSVTEIRDRLKAGGAPENGVRDAVAAFDSLTGQYARQLVELVPMSKARISRLKNQRFHDLREVQSIFKGWFDIDICQGMRDAEVSDVALMFHRRHVYEHNGGEVDQRYLDESGDQTVKPKQALHESVESAHALLGSLLKMAKNLHAGFHELIPPLEGPIKAFADQTAHRRQLAARDANRSS